MRNFFPARYANVTPSDTIAVGGTVGLLIGGAGNLVVKGADGLQATITVVAGQFVQGRFPYVMAATTATGIVACFNE